MRAGTSPYVLFKKPTTANGNPYGLAASVFKGKRMTLYKWSQTASADATADNTINWAEGQAPSSVNDSARAMMAATAKYRDDIAGAIVTTGTNTSYAVSSYQGFDTLAHLDGQMIAFTPHITNAGQTTTLNVDSLGQRPLRTSPGVVLQDGTIIQGTPYVAVYNNSDGVFYLQGFYGNRCNRLKCCRASFAVQHFRAKLAKISPGGLAAIGLFCVLRGRVFWTALSRPFRCLIRLGGGIT